MKKIYYVRIRHRPQNGYTIRKLVDDDRSNSLEFENIASTIGRLDGTRGSMDKLVLSRMLERGDAKIVSL